MYTQDSALKLIELVYAAGCDPSKWESFLATLSETMGASGADILVIQDRDRPSAHVRFGAGIVVPELRREYAAVAAHDPFMVAAKRVGFLRTGAVELGETLVPMPELKRSDFYNEFGKRYEYVGGLSGIIAKERTITSTINVCRRPSTPFGEPELNLIRLLMPHVQRALQVHTRLAEAESREGAFRATLNRIATGAALVDSDGRILFANESARATLDERDGLTLDRGTLRTARPRETTILLNLIGEAAETTQGESLRCGGIMLVGRRSGKTPLQLIVSPLPGADREVQPPPAARAIVFIVDPDHAPETDTELIRRSYGLSRAETEVALLLLQDKTAHEISDLLYVSVNTIRFHLKHMLAKTGARRQSELVRRLSETWQIRRISDAGPAPRVSPSWR